MYSACFHTDLCQTLFSKWYCTKQSWLLPENFFLTLLRPSYHPQIQSLPNVPRHLPPCNAKEPHHRKDYIVLYIELLLQQTLLCLITDEAASYRTMLSFPFVPDKPHLHPSK